MDTDTQPSTGLRRGLSLRARMAIFFSAGVAAALLLFSTAVIAVLVLDDDAEGHHGAPTDSDEDVGQVLLTMVALAPLAVAGAAGAGWLLAKKSLEPLREAGRRARVAQQSQQELDLPVTGRGDEWDELALTVNALLATTRQSVERVRRFTADAAHELRTPLTTVLGEADLALRRERSPEELRAAITVIHGEAERLATLADKLLALARADTAELPLSPEPLRLDALADEAIARARSRAAQLGRSVELAHSLEPVELRADRGLLERAVQNLLDNAVLHGGSHVVVALRRGTDTVELAVRDDGPGVPASLRPFLFERFACGDDSRSRGGTGLGLAIARAIAKAHQGELSYVEGPGAHFRLVLPLPGR
ncbi:MAG: HAMP domain-containing histidine kinase [Deltaproteobacteria bacterium]|nr:HAMP domain-containing histidine kinase [Deltaproteobacteria bacterium]